MVSLRNIFNRIFRRDPNKRSKSESKEDRNARHKSPLSLSMVSSRVEKESEGSHKKGRAKKYKKVNESQESGVNVPSLQMLDHSDLLKISQIRESALTSRRNLNDSVSKDLENLASRTNKYLMNESQCETKRQHPLSAVSTKDVDFKNFSALKNKPTSRILSSLPVNKSTELAMLERNKSCRRHSKEKLSYFDQDVPVTNSLGRIFARSQAYLQKNRQNIENALRNIELLDPKYNNRVIGRPYQDKENQLQHALGDKKNLGSQANNGKLPTISANQKENSSKNTKNRKSSAVVKQNNTKGKENSALSQRDINQKQPIVKVSRSLQEIQQDKINGTWNRLEIKSRGIQQSVSSFEKEIEKVDRLFMKNALAMVDLTSVREDLLNLYLTEDIKAHKKKRKHSNAKRIQSETNVGIPSN